MAAKIAIIEDDAAISDMYQFKLQKVGYDVRVARSGSEGLKLVFDFRPDLILLDLMMPEMTGDEVLSRVRSKPGGGAVKVIILTNVGRDEATSRMGVMEVDRYIVKAHYTPAQVLDVVKEVLEPAGNGPAAGQ